MATPKNRPTKSDNFTKGSGFENLVRDILIEGGQQSDRRMTYRCKPKLKLQNGETVIPDFVITTKTPHEVRHFYIECQNRQRSTKDILHKIQHVRVKHKAKTFIYVYANKLGAELARAFKREAVQAMSLAEFRYFIRETASFINYRLSDMRVVRVVNSTQPHLPLPQKTTIAFHSHPDAQKMIEEFLKRGSEPGADTNAPSTPSH